MPMDMQDSSDMCCCRWNPLLFLGKGHWKGKADVKRF